MTAPRDIAERVAKWSREGPQGPMTLELYPTLKCNLSCAFCDTTDRHRPPVDELSRERLLELVEEAAAIGVRRVFVLGGGEPLAARNSIDEVLTRTKSLGMEGILTTNGVLMGPRIRQLLVDSAWDEVHVSIDSPDPAVHDELRGQQGAFKRTVQNICRLQALKRQTGATAPAIALHFVLTNKNWRSLPDMVRLGAALGVFRIDFDALIAYTPDQLSLQLSPQEQRDVAQVARQAMQVADELGIATTLANFLNHENLRRGENQPEAPAAGEGFTAAPCLKAWHYLVVQADGRISPCCVLAGEGESVAQRPLEELWRESPYLNDIRDSMLRGQPTSRCRECSANILVHEAEIRDQLRLLEESPSEGRD